MSRIPYYIIAVCLILSSCSGYKKITYLRGIAEEFPDTLLQKEKREYHIQPADILYIRIITNNEATDKLFNLIGSSQNIQNTLSSGGLYLLGYEVTDSGYIELPVIKNVYVDGLTLEEAKFRIREMASKYIKDPQIIIKLNSFQFTILGEVKNPGIKDYGTSQINMLEAVALAGDITYNGNRENILIIRSLSDGSRIFRVDMTDKNLVSTDAFYIQPNDVIYVTPLKSTLFRVRASDYLFILSTITTTLTLILLLVNIL